MKIRTTIKKGEVEDELVVRLHVNGIHIKESGYFTADMRDAIEAAKAMEFEYITKNNINDETCFSIKKLKSVSAAAFVTALRNLSRQKQLSILRRFNLPDVLASEIQVLENGVVLYEQVVS